MIEIFKKIEGEKYYLVSNLGTVLRIEHSRLINGIKRHYRKKIIKPFDNGNGYLKVKLTDENGCNIYYIHRLVIKTFCPQLTPKEQVRHRDGNRQNNCLENLEWGTPLENAQDKKNYNVKRPI